VLALVISTAKEIINQSSFLNLREVYLPDLPMVRVKVGASCRNFNAGYMDLNNLKKEIVLILHSGRLGNF
jgi:hypothetical protein